MEFEVIAVPTCILFKDGEPEANRRRQEQATLLRELGYHVRYGQRAQRLSRGLNSATRMSLWTRVGAAQRSAAIMCSGSSDFG
jgi:hypothetical protein